MGIDLVNVSLQKHLITSPEVRSSRINQVVSDTTIFLRDPRKGNSEEAYEN